MFKLRKKIFKTPPLSKKVKLIISFCILLPIFLVFYSNHLIQTNADQKTFFDTAEIPKNKVGLVLGTAKNLKDGRRNSYFQYRIIATAELYKKGKIEYVLVSGDNGNKNYDEPTDFKEELIKYGIPENKIYLDFAGFRTLDSVIRAKKIFGQQNLTIISQKFHNERAIYLAEKNEINAVGFNAKDVSGRNGLSTKIREYFARTKAYIDIVLGIGPKFLGEAIEIK